MVFLEPPLSVSVWFWFHKFLKLTSLVRTMFFPYKAPHLCRCSFPTQFIGMFAKAAVSCCLPWAAPVRRTEKNTPQTIYYVSAPGAPFPTPAGTDRAAHSGDFNAAAARSTGNCDSAHQRNGRAAAAGRALCLGSAPAQSSPLCTAHRRSAGSVRKHGAYGALN